MLGRKNKVGSMDLLTYKCVIIMKKIHKKKCDCVYEAYYKSKTFRADKQKKTDCSTYEIDR